uniref:C2H2-type domain-containing protein n=1 Tax=Oncorhynchus mykiss TaxID=8022 RepID=A0A8C7PA85_ONCMY
MKRPISITFPPGAVLSPCPREPTQNTALLLTDTSIVGLYAVIESHSPYHLLQPRTPSSWRRCIPFLRSAPAETSKRKHGNRFGSEFVLISYSHCIKEEETPEQEWSPSLRQEKPEPTQIKEEQEEIWTSQEVEQLQGLESDTIEFVFTPCVKSECDLPQTQTVDGRGSDFKLSSPLREPTKSSTVSKKPHCCLDCGKCFTQIGRLKMHSRIHSEAKPFCCGDCGNRFQLKGELTNHIVIHTGEKPFNCGDCGKSFNRKLTLNRHILLVHKEGTQYENGTTKGEKPFCCGDCGKSFTRRQTLNRHKMIHTGEKPFHCGYCGKGFNRKETLIDHIQNHTGEKPFSCGNCGKSFNRKRNLTSHLLTHTEEKPFSCVDCGKSFKQKSDLTKHIMIHMEEKPFKCGECGKSFNYKVNLNRHILFIHKERK